MILDEFRILIADCENLDDIMGLTQMPSLVSRYNKLLKEVQGLHPRNTFIQTKTPINYNPIFGDMHRTANDIKLNSKSIIESITSLQIQQAPQHIINIGEVHGDFSFESIINYVERTNITSKTEIINNINEFKQELNKNEPDKNKLKKIMEKVSGAGEKIVVGLLVEFAKKALGL